MTWIPCTICHNAPCTCWGTVQPYEPPWIPLVPSTTTFTWPLPQRLADEDVERIAKKVVELLDARKPAPKPENHWQKLAREWMEWLKEVKENLK